jgi:hypothetical protein
MSLRTKFFKWLTHGQIQVTPPQEMMRLSSSGGLGIGAVSPSTYSVDSTSEQASTNLKFIKAKNGTVVEVSTYFTNKHGHMDRTVETYVVAQGEKLSETILTILTIKALEDK